MDKWILKGKTPVIEPDTLKWGRWFEENNRIVKQEHIGPYFISTIFLGLDHAFGGGPPLLFETMIFDDNKDEEYQERFSTWEEAEKGHEEAVLYAKNKFFDSLEKKFKK